VDNLDGTDKLGLGLVNDDGFPAGKPRQLDGKMMDVMKLVRSGEQKRWIHVKVIQYYSKVQTILTTSRNFEARTVTVYAS
jgi:hypothetical protein